MHFLANIPIEYIIVSLSFLTIFISIKFSQFGWIKVIAFPVAVAIWVAIETYQILKLLQSNFLKKQVQQGNRYIVLFLLVFIVSVGIITYLLSYVFLALMTKSPWYYLPSFVLSTLAKYFNLVLVPEVIRYGNDKLTSFALYRWCFNLVYTFWQKFKKTKLYKKLSRYTIKIRSWTRKTAAKLKAWLQETFPKKEKSSIFGRMIEQIKLTLDALKK